MKFCLITILFILIYIQQVLGAACCGGGSGLPSLITGDYRGQLTTSFSQAKIVGEKLHQEIPYFWPKDKTFYTRSLKIDATYQFDNYFQFGVSSSVLMKDYRFSNGANNQDHGISDIGLTAAYCFLPELNFSRYRPVGFSFAKLTIPTGKSIYESNDPAGADVSGKGFYIFSLGLAFVKTLGIYDWQIMGEGHSFIERTFKHNSHITKVKPGPGGSLLFSLGWSPYNSDWRLGGSISPHYEGEKVSSFNSTKSRSGYELYWDTSFSLSKLLSEEYMASFNYTDQTILGPVNNTNLSRTLTFSFQKRWAL